MGPGLEQAGDNGAVVGAGRKRAALQIQLCPEQGGQVFGELEGAGIEAPVGGLQLRAIQVVNR